MKFEWNRGPKTKGKSTHKSSSLRTKLKQIATLRRTIGSNKITLARQHDRHD